MKDKLLKEIIGSKTPINKREFEKKYKNQKHIINTMIKNKVIVVKDIKSSGSNQTMKILKVP